MVSLRDLASGKYATYRFVLLRYAGIVLSQHPEMTQDAQVQLLIRMLYRLRKQAQKRQEGNAHRVVTRVVAKVARMTDESLEQAESVTVSAELMETVLAGWKQLLSQKRLREQRVTCLGGVSVALFIVLIITASILIHQSQLAAGVGVSK